ncbi:MAG TPA: outer membrane beta-barrel protein, partial [Croceibacterium sp.]|nr:outer membrane beta-barrel protein [Croceibacterium sp.]
MAVAASALAAPAMAEDGQGYFGADMGVVVKNDIDVAISGTQDAAQIESDLGWELGGFLGYDFGMIRAEAEVAYRETDADNIVSTVRGIPYFTATPVTGTFSPIAGELQLTTAMVNAMFDIGGNDGIGFSAGVGAGHAWVDTQFSGAVGPGYLDDKDHDWAWQAIAAVRFPVTDEAEIGLKYRYLNTRQFELTDTSGRANAFEIESHSALVTFIANLGGAAPPPPPPPPAPPPPAPPPPPPPAPAPRPVAQCNQGPYIVFFDWDKSDITPEAAGILNN